MKLCKHIEKHLPCLSHSICHIKEPADIDKNKCPDYPKDMKSPALLPNMKLFPCCPVLMKYFIHKHSRIICQNHFLKHSIQNQLQSLFCIFNPKFMLFE